MTIYYVNGTSGDDNKDGKSAANAWKTIGKATGTNLAVGDIVRIKPGTYYEQVTITRPGTTWTVDGDGSDPVTIDGRYSYATAWTGSLTGDELKKPENVPTAVIAGRYASMVQILADDVTLDGKQKYGILMRNIGGRFMGINGCANTIVRYVRGDFCYSDAVTVQSTNNTLIEHCAFTRSTMLTWGPLRNGKPPNLKRITPSTLTSPNAKNTTIRDVYIAYATGEGFVAYQGSVGTLFEDCEAANLGHGYYYADGGRDAVFDGCIAWADPYIPEGQVSPYATGKGLISNGFMAGDEKHASTSRNAKFINCLMVGCKDGLQFRGNVKRIWNSETQTWELPNYWNSQTDFYFGHCTIVGYRPPDANLTDIQGSQELVYMSDTLERVEQGVMHGGIVENCNFLFMDGHVPSGTNTQPAKVIPPHNIVFRNNVWYKTPPANVRGVGDKYESPMLSNQKYKLPKTGYTATVRRSADMPPIVSLRDNLAWAELISDSPGRNNGAKGAVTKNNKTYTPPSRVAYDIFGAARDTSPDCGFAEYNGTVPPPEDELTAQFSVSATSGTPPFPVEFTDESYGNVTITSWSWDFKDGSTSTEQNPVHVYTAPGLYTPTLTIRSSGGLERTATGPTIQVKSPPSGAPSAYDAITGALSVTAGPQELPFPGIGSDVPTGLMLIISGAAVGGTLSDDAALSVGFTDGVIQWCTSFGTESGTAGAASDTINALGAILDVDGNVVGSVNLVGFEPGSATININANLPSAYRFIAVAFSSTKVSVSRITLSGVNVDVPHTMPDITPNAMFTFGNWAGSNLYNTQAMLSLGSLAGSAQSALAWRYTGEASATKVMSWSESSRVGRSFPTSYLSVSSVSEGRALYKLTNTALTNSGNMISVGMETGGQTFASLSVIPAVAGQYAITSGFEPGLAILFGSLASEAGATNYDAAHANTMWIAVVTETAQYIASVTVDDAVLPPVSKSFIGSGSVKIHQDTSTVATDLQFVPTGTGLQFTVPGGGAPGDKILVSALLFEKSDGGTEPPPPPGEPVIDFSISPTQLTEGESVTLTDVTNLNGAVATNMIVNWDDGESEDILPGESVVHTYIYPGTYIPSIALDVNTGEHFTKEFNGSVIVRDLGDPQRIVYGIRPHPMGVTNYTETKVFEGDVPEELFGKFTQGANFDAVVIDYEPTDLTSPMPGKIRAVYSRDDNAIIFIRPDGATSTLTLPDWVGGGEPSPSVPPPVISPISNPNGGPAYQVEWLGPSPISGYTLSYVLQEAIGSGAYADVYSGTAELKAFAGKATGTYTYRVKTVATPTGDGIPTIESVWSGTASTTVVDASTAPVTITKTILNASDDASQVASGTVALGESYINTTKAGSFGFARFNNITIPQGATVSAATLAVNVSSTYWDDPDVVFKGEKVANSPTATIANGDISGRTRTTASVAFSGTGIGAGLKEINVQPIIKEIIDQGTWVPGNALSLIWESLSESNFRVLSYEGGAEFSPKLTITYAASGATPPNAPTLNAISNVDGDGNYTVSWGVVSGAESYTLQEKFSSDTWDTIYSGANTSFAVTGRAVGTWTYRVSATDNDTGLISVYSAEQSTTVSSAGGPVTVTYGPTASNHDAWETWDGIVDVDDAILQGDSAAKLLGLYVDASADVGTLGGATVSSAYLQYYPPNTTRDDPNVIWYGEAVDTAAPFDTTTNNVRLRKLNTPTTATATDTGTGVGIGLRSIDVTEIVREIVLRAGWTGPIVLVGDPQEGSNIRMYSFDNGSSIWSLEITYTP